ncbi:GH36-type glycosyl hydrolase domain-containing protein [Pseudomonas panipatensis]|uniref:Cyclic beta-1,2-glucan synthetase n=1 Tax=Pseudomonas panipatensis TaxID=428992 RepID=A0A1G8KZ80_9PSED|nr:glucoamylase family protein [Pseudomonas panipatensis]SDI48699.1 cyclic beta-1,2-glucan synthetase [Pseudomonas panipatensis]SMP72967.1 cyclic beta-1,2-glucan synthetase [Pseudomonas panipatensis]
MNSNLPRVFGRSRSAPPWDSLAPVREELFGIERLEQHAQTLAVAQQVTERPTSVLPLHLRLNANATVLLAAYRASAAELESGHAVVPAAEWLLDNYHIVEEQIREVRDDLPPGYYRQLPKLAAGPFAGYPRVFGLTWAFVAHTDSHLDLDLLRRFICAYQRVQPLTIGELWAVAITLRIVLIENLRRLAEQIDSGRVARADADALADRLLAPGGARTALDADIATRPAGPLSEIFAAQLAKRLRDQDPRSTPALGWLEERLQQQGVAIDEVVQHAQQRQGASNVTVRNVITSMRLISDTDWARLFESVSLVDARLRSESAFAAMDFPTRNLYRNAIEQLARGSPLNEQQVVEQVLECARQAARNATQDEVERTRAADPGYHLIAQGRLPLERAIGFRAPLRLRISRFNVRLGMGGYLGAILLLSVLLLALLCLALSGPALASGWLLLFLLCLSVPVSEVATALVNRMVTWSFGAVTLPGLELLAGVPHALRTLIAVPTLLGSEAELLEQVERLEVHHLAGIGGDLAFALLVDGVDAQEEVLDSDTPLLETAAAAIERLNQRYGPGPGGQRFFLLCRRRLFNASEGCWMGWERKRGKLHELNRLLRGASDTSFMSVADQPLRVPAGVRFVITLDADTRLPREAALRLIGKMAHPLNRPRFDARQQRVVNGYAILQPRVTPSLPMGGEGSLYQRLFSGPAGMDPYAAAVSDIYQDLFGEGSYTGKGIYDVDAFEAALADRVADNRLLSHDLFEGIFARAGLASDVEVVEESPARVDVATRRLHRWTRGDWQLLPWALGHWRGVTRVPLVGRCKMLDNLRRSLFAPFALASLLLCWWPPLPQAALATLCVLMILAIPVLLPVLCGLPPQRRGIRWRTHFGTLGTDFCRACLQLLLSLAFLPHQAWNMGDAIVRSLWRMTVSHRHLLEWTTAAQSSSRPLPDLPGSYRQMAGGTALALLAGAVGLLALTANWPLILPLLLLWLGAPILALYSSQPPRPARRLSLSPADAEALRLLARRTWRFFETFVTPADNLLPPDNFQEQPKPVLAHRTSPTNIGLYLLSTVAARDFGWAGSCETLERLEATLAVLDRLPRSHGHFFNWYATGDLRVLEPAYVSSVDSGNLAGHLIVLANACEEWRVNPLAAEARQGLLDDLQMVRQAIAELSIVGAEALRQLNAELEEIRVALEGPQALEALLPSLRRLAEKLARVAHGMLPAERSIDSDDLLFWIEALCKALAEHSRDRQAQARAGLDERLQRLADTARALAMGMDFGFLLNQERKLLSIGYSQDDNRLDAGCYDLLASEARLASLFAIAKGDLPTRHWFRLGRTATPVDSGAALISWSGSMFEYLMPSLVMRAPDGSLLEQSNRLVVIAQAAYGARLGLPWGVSESAYNARDAEFTYQYSNFGVPGLGLKRGLAENVVIAPYATGLAAMVDAQAACRNFARLAEMGALGRYGFYEALDFTRTRLPEDASMAIVRSFMAHHQGMTIVAIANALQDGRMRCRLHREPMIQASELLLQERVPRDVALAHPRAEEVRVAATEEHGEASSLRRIDAAAGGPPITHLLSNGRYALMLTATGAGYSRWGDIAVTRWREDSTCDAWGSFIFLRDVQSGALWSATLQPSGVAVENSEVRFDEDHAEFIQSDGSLMVSQVVLVSGEDDGEVRRVSLINHGRRPREIELTSYAEVVLATPAADNAHPVFSKMFVQSEYLAEFNALVATRRPRSPGEAPIWAAHFAVVEGEVSAEPQYESDRARFLGRGHGLRDAQALAGHRPLSNSHGTVLDPIFSLRQRLRVAPGKVARVAFWTVVASSREALLDLIDKHHERNAFERAKTLAWTQAQVELRDLGIDPEEAADFQRLAAPILYADPRFRAPAEAIRRGAGSQAGLWPLAISGDLPIVLLRIDEIEDLALVRQLLRACEYWRKKGLDVDLVIVNERASSYVQDLQVAIETSVRSCQSRPHLPGQSPCGGVHTLRADLMSLEARELLQSVARVSLMARRGSIAAQLARLAQPPLDSGEGRQAPAPGPVLPAPPVTEGPPSLEFFNGLGGFDRDGGEYLIVLEREQNTPAPWINVIANAAFGFQVSAEGSGYTWAGNSRDNQLTPWSNDPVADPLGEVFYLRDEDSRALWSVTARPIRDAGTYRAAHGFGYSRFSHTAHGIAAELLQYVPLDDPLKISRLTLRNLSGRPRRISVTAYVEWVLGTARGASGPFIQTEHDTSSGALLAHNPWSLAFSSRVAFVHLDGRLSAWTADRGEFLGRNGSPAAPRALLGDAPLSGTCGAGLDPCAALQCEVELGIGESVEVLALLGQAGSAEEARTLLLRYRMADLDALLEAVRRHWHGLLGAIQVRTPDRAMDVMLNGWLLYQTLACRIRARSAFYQASGAYGFRDQLQDSLALSFACPEETRRHLLRAAGRQFVEGDVQHWWLPQTGQGVRTRISDDRVWLAFACATYIATSADSAVLDEPLAFLEGAPLHPDESDAFFQPMLADHSASLFEHCARGLDQCLELTGAHGLPLIGTGDWNDGMNRVGAGGEGESVWLGWLLLRTLHLFAPLAAGRDEARAQRWREHAVLLQRALEREAWDGEWYRRATFDDGTWLGSAAAEECRIDAIAQSWAVLSGGAAADRAATAMESMERLLIRRADGLALLFTPPFDRAPVDPGYIKGYPPGLRENGGQYSHAAMWSILALTRLGEGDKAAELFALLNPINHARTPDQVQRYKVEPYVVAADVYSVEPHVGRGGWTWYTGAAGWMYQAGVEGILGLRREGACLVIDPCIPRDWPGYELRLTLGESRYEISLVRLGQACRGLQRAVLDDAPLACADGRVRIALAAGAHHLQLFL